MDESARQTQELKREQAERETQEWQRLERSELPAEADQHKRRRDKAAYLKAKLAERERSERES